MRRTLRRLTQSQVNKLRKIKGMHADGGGLYLQTTAPGTASWIFRYAVPGRRHDRFMGLGPLHTVSLAEAREKALECRKLRLAGTDPIEERKLKRLQTALESARTVTFAQCAQLYIGAHQAGWKNHKHAQQWSSTLEAYVYPTFGSLAVKAVDVALVMRAIEPFWNDKPATASRVRGRIEAVLDWATARGYRQGENPARWRGHLENLLPAHRKVRTTKHHPAMPFRQLPAFMAALRQRPGIAARALQFLILTAARTNEVRGARWSEIDTEARLWVIPPERMKGGREHRVPLSEPALAILALLNREHPMLFPIGNGAMAMVLARIGRADLTVHGFRSSFSDWCAEMTNTSSEVREMALAHKVSNAVEAAYRRGDLAAKRAELMAAWAAYCDGELGAAIQPLRRAAG